MSKLNSQILRSSTQFRVVTDVADIPALIRLAREAHEESRFSYIPFSVVKTRRIGEDAIKNSRYRGLFIAEKAGLPVGFAYCSVGEYHIGESILLATIHNINVLRSIRASLMGGRVALGLFRGVETWSQARGAREVLFHVTSGIGLSRTHNLAKRVGYKLIGGSYAR